MRIALPYEATAGMRIEDSKSEPARTEASTTTAGHTRSGQQPISRQARDSVAVSDMSNLLSHLGARAGSDRAAMINRITEQHRSGKYIIDNVALAEALISGAFEG